MSLIPPMTWGLRLANHSDLPRIGLVAAAGFYHSPIFHFDRPRHASYLLYTLADYRTTYQRATLDPASAVLVVEDDYNAEEVGATYGALSLIHIKLQDKNPPKRRANSSSVSQAYRYSQTLAG
ncbi:MAG: hypothetical protein ASARMPREDX12_000470 [Alectoria sarmentosa]|nr:MAG: hypothetical protein ASARMPREDX12_000470 [Alectoria sarmentosa]